ncbi:hypothetical protein [Haliangium sp.]|uniref:hypothetical protein n=1 Tax=Haliangium sp. TaxID=2663208 RepID=UPI003D125902
MLEQHVVTRALLGEVERAHAGLAEQEELRRQLTSELARLTELLGETDEVFDRKARGLHGGLSAVAEATNDEGLADTCLRILERLFPEGLGIVNRSYLYEAGEVDALERRLSADLVDAMGTIQIGDQSAADIYQAWLTAGHALGRQVHERDVLAARIRRDGSAAADMDVRGARLRWINTVKAFLSGIDLAGFTDAERELLLSSLAAAVEQARRGRDVSEPGEPGTEPPVDTAPSEPGDPGTEPPVDTAPSDPSEPGEPGPVPVEPIGVRADGIGTSPGPVA